MSSAVANPAFVPLAAAFRITPVQASYELAVYVRTSSFQLLPLKPNTARVTLSVRSLEGTCEVS